MMNYRKTIKLKTNDSGQVSLETDRNQQWVCYPVNHQYPMTEWTRLNPKTALSYAQKEAMKDFFDGFFPVADTGSFIVYKVAQRGHGFGSFETDAVLYRIPEKSFWMLSNSFNTWIKFSTQSSFDFAVDEADGPLIDKTVSDAIYAWSCEQRGSTFKRRTYTDKDYQKLGLAIR